MPVYVEGCPLQHDKFKEPGDCRICPQAQGCILLILLKKLAKIEEEVRDISRKLKK